MPQEACEGRFEWLATGPRSQIINARTRQCLCYLLIEMLFIFLHGMAGAYGLGVEGTGPAYDPESKCSAHAPCHTCGNELALSFESASTISTVVKCCSEDEDCGGPAQVSLTVFRTNEALRSL